MKHKHLLIIVLLLVGMTTLINAQTNCLTFDGINDYVNFGDVLDIGTSDWSYQFWFKTAGATGGLMGKTIHSSTVGRWGTFFYTGGSYNGLLRTIFQFQTSTQVELDAVNQAGNIPWNDGTWHNASVTCDRDGYITLYMDGAFNIRLSIAGSNGYNMQTSGNFYMGTYGSPNGSVPQPGFYLNGSLDEARVWNKCLTAEEVANNYNTQIAYPQDSLVGYWRMNQDTGTIMDDEVVPGHSGTLVNGPTWTPNGPPTLPVELSSFTAVLTSDFLVKLQWTTQSETGVSGFNVYRGSENNLSSATLLSGQIEATNTGDHHQYDYYDTDVYEPGTYYYWLSVQDYDGSVDYHGPTTVLYDNSTHQGTPDIPIEYGLRSIFPNPFNPSTTIAYTLVEDAEVSFVIYNSRGQVMRRFSEGHKSVGNWRLVWDGLDSNGRACTTGIYHVRMQAGNDYYSKKAMLLK